MYDSVLLLKIICDLILGFDSCCLILSDGMAHLVSFVRTSFLFHLVFQGTLLDMAVYSSETNAHDANPLALLNYKDITANRLFELFENHFGFPAPSTAEAKQRVEAQLGVYSKRMNRKNKMHLEKELLLGTIDQPLLAAWCPLFLWAHVVAFNGERILSRPSKHSGWNTRSYSLQPRNSD